MRQAHAVARDLESSGFDSGSINLLANRSRAGLTTGATAGTTIGTTQRTSAAESAATGAGAEYEAGLTPITVDGIGPALSRGPLGTVLAGGGPGALMKKGVPEQDANCYLEGVKRGGVMVAVTCPDDKAVQAAEIMQRHGALDIDRMSEQWKKQGWTAFQAEGHREGAEARTGLHEGRSGLHEERILPLAEEDVKVGKREVPEGLVRVYTHVESVPIQENVSLREEHATIERRPVDRPLGDADRDVFKETSVEVREMREEPVVSKDARITEEVVVGKESTQRMETVRDTARQTKVQVDRGQEGRRNAAGFGSDDEDFRRHFQSLSGSKGDFDTYRSAYHYADEPEAMQLRGREWSDVEPELHRSWDRKHPGGTWDQFKDAIRYGWNKKRH